MDNLLQPVGTTLTAGVTFFFNIERFPSEVEFMIRIQTFSWFIMATNKDVSTQLSDLKDDKASVTSQAVGATFVLSAHEQHVRDQYAKFSPEEARAIEKKLKLKLDLRLFPTLMIMYILNYIDRNALPIAKLAGIQQELGLSSTQYSTCLSILFVGYL